LNYLNWLQKTYPELNEISNETINSHIDKAKSDTELFREFIKVLGSLFFIIPFNLYLVMASIAVGGFIGLYCEQKVIKKRLKKIIQLKAF